ncbi:hypothetical protein UlMin_022874 [Ulmus minor]
MFKIFDPSPLSEGFTVFDLPLHNGEWDSEFIDLLFGEEEAEKILSLPLGSFEHDDVLIWHFSQDGEYLVKSGYKVAFDAKGYVESSNPSFSIGWWRKLWGMKLPPKVKVFCCKLCKGWLPSTNTLAHRGMNVNAKCFRCGLGLETIFHAIWGCDLARKVWNLSGIKHIIERFCENDILSFMACVSGQLENYFRLFLVMDWQLWNARNDHYHGNLCPHASHLFSWSVNFLSEFLDVMNTGVSRLPRSTDKLAWKPPEEGMLCLNVDVAINNGDDSCGVGMILRDHKGEVKFSKAIFWPFPVTVKVAEAFAVLWGIQTTIEAGFANFMVISNCSNAVSNIKDTSLIFNDYGVILSEIKTFLSRNLFLDVFCMSRNLNGAAHCIACLAAKSRLSRMWREAVLSVAWSAVKADKHSYL